MERALELAQAHHPHPNPRVGAVVVSDAGQILGEGAHIAPGLDHAEVVALSQAGVSAGGATLYVTLEPCSHHGRTPPCVDAIIASGVTRVVIGNLDPDPRVSGTGADRLREAGVEVIEWDEGERARSIDRAYFHHRETGMPMVTLKYAMTLDGAVAAADNSSKWITGDLARADVHGLRADADAVVVGAGTVLADDPHLDVRIPGYTGRQPRPVVVAGNRPLPEAAAIWARDPIVVAATPMSIPAGELMEVDGAGGRPDPEGTCRSLADAGYLSLLLEGGPTLASSWWNAGVVARGVVYLGARVGGGTGKAPLGGAFPTIDDARIVTVTGVRSLGGDVRIDFEV